LLLCCYYPLSRKQKKKALVLPLTTLRKGKEVGWRGVVSIIVNRFAPNGEVSSNHYIINRIVVRRDAISPHGHDVLIDVYLFEISTLADPARRFGRGGSHRSHLVLCHTLWFFGYLLSLFWKHVKLEFAWKTVWTFVSLETF
jgi:hypothetical protein